MSETINVARESYSCSLVTQGNWKFYSLTMPSDVLSETCFVSARDDNPSEGFQRILDKDRAQDIADYIDDGTGSIPTAIILSAQDEADLLYSSKKKTIEFNRIPKAFLILDGQHRVYGFSLAAATVRVPVIIYSGLTRKEETRLFVDINTKQRPVPSELLLDIKSLAEYENDIEAFCRQIFDLFNEKTDSCLFGMMSPASRMSGKISRVTFNSAIKPIYGVFGEREATDIFQILNSYLKAIYTGFNRKGNFTLTKSTVFKSIMQLFPHVARLVEGQYSIERFSEVLSPMFLSVSLNKVEKSNSVKNTVEYLQGCLNRGFTL